MNFFLFNFSTVSIDSASEIEKLDSNSILCLNERNLYLFFTETNIVDPKLTRKQRAKEIGTSESTNER